jgi:hypothetical protein
VAFSFEIVFLSQLSLVLCTRPLRDSKKVDCQILISRKLLTGNDLQNLESNKFNLNFQKFVKPISFRFIVVLFLPYRSFGVVQRVISENEYNFVHKSFFIFII